jgi:hypothetical protein
LFERGKITIASGLLLFTLCVTASAQRSSVVAGINTVHAQVPNPILKGKRAFISYELGAVTAFPDKYSGGPERAYSEFYNQMQTWGRYELVNDPKDADLVFAVRFVAEEAYPQIRLGITNSQGISLWGFVEAIDPAIFKKHRDASFSATVKLLVADVQTLTGPGESAADKKARKQ